MVFLAAVGDFILGEKRIRKIGKEPSGELAILENTDQLPNMRIFGERSHLELKVHI